MKKVRTLVLVCLLGATALVAMTHANGLLTMEPGVRVDLHIMSKCPFGVKVVEAMIPVARKLDFRLDLKVHYIGRSQDGQFNSLHGEEEVQGDILQLCARAVGDTKQWLNFLECQIRDWRTIPEGWEACARSAKISVSQMKECAGGSRGKRLLEESFAISTEKKASGSPTIFVADEPYRGGRSELSFARAICRAIGSRKPTYCTSLPAPVRVSLTVVADKRCQGRGCDPDRFLAFAKATFEGAVIKVLDFSEPAGRALYRRAGEKYLPIAVFGPEIQMEETGYNRLKRRLRRIDGSEDLVYPLGRDWDPYAEVCDDRVDNTGNGRVDCDDPTCFEKKACRRPIKNKLDIFVMSQCPYGVRTVDAMKEVLENFRKNRELIDFEINYIGNERDGQLTSMHGQEEVDENIRQLCAQKHYREDYKFMDYVLCRNKDYRSPDWESCAGRGIEAGVIRRCSTGDEGKRLLSASFKKANDLGISGSPNWLLNNRYDMNGRDPEAIKSAFCAKNAGTRGCENVLSTGDAKPVPAGACGS